MPISSPHIVIMGNSIDINVNPSSSESEIRADVRVAQYTAIRIWGQVTNTQNEPVSNAQVKLVKIIDTNQQADYVGIAHTTTDCEGFYQFDICSNENGWYKILVGKSTTGKEIIIGDTSQCYPPSF